MSILVYLRYYFMLKINTERYKIKDKKQRVKAGENLRIN